MKFDNRVALVSGAGGNIGYDICKQLGAAGVHIAATDIRFDCVKKMADEMQSLGYDVRPYEQDQTSPESVRTSLAAIQADFGKIDILVNNAGAWLTRDGRCRVRFDDLEEDDWHRIININLVGTCRMIHEVLPGMLSRGYGRIINLGSITGEQGVGGMTPYSAAKAGVIMLTKCIAMENAKRGITCNSVSPGMIGKTPEKNWGTWLGVSGTGSDVARAVMFFADDDAGYITGVDMPVDGGRILGCHGENMD